MRQYGGVSEKRRLIIKIDNDEQSSELLIEQTSG